jgi:hypothetical protein
MVLASIFLFAPWSLVEHCCGQQPASAIKISNETVYRITMTTTFVVPAGNDKISQLRVYHALPTVRPWSKSSAKFGASDLSFTPKTAKQECHAATDSHYLLWTTNKTEKPGTKFTLATTMTVASVDRTLNLAAAKVTWNDYVKPAKNKTAVVDLSLARRVHPELAKTAAKLKASLPPPEAVQAMCQWIVDTIKYDAAVPFPPSDVDSILRIKRGHCGHQATVLEQMTASAGIPFRTVWGLNLYAPDGRTSDLQKVRADYTNIHTWAEVYFPGIGWVEVDPELGTSAFSLPAHQIQCNRWFQNYSIWMRESGMDKQPTWTTVQDGFQSDYGVEHIISYSKKKK